MANYTGTPGNDTLVGSEGGDTLIDGPAGSPGNDTLLGNGGADFLWSRGGADSIDGGSGNDTLSLDRPGTGLDLAIDMVQAATTTGMGLADGTWIRNVEVGVIRLGSGNDLVIGRGGENQFYGGGGSDYLEGAGGYDRLYGEGGNDTLSGGLGSDDLYGGAGHDWLEDAGGFARLNGEDGNDTLIAAQGELYGGGGDDRLEGTDRTVRFFGEAGDDIVLAGEGNDSLVGGVGHDTLNGGNGWDTLYSGEMTGLEGIISIGIDELNGGGGNDRLYSHGGADTIDGGADIDVLTLDRTGQISPSLRNFVVDMNAAATAAGTVLVDFTVLRNLEAIEFFSGSGNDSFVGAAGWDLFKGNVGNDTGWGGTSNDWLDGGSGDDVLGGQDGNDTVKGLGDNDQLSGEAGNDSLLGGEGMDSLDGGGDNDFLDGETGADVMTGGLGDDTFIVDHVNDRVMENHLEGNDLIRSVVSYSLFGRAIETLILTGVGHIDATGNSLDNTLTGNVANNRLDGGSGNDTLSGGIGNDTYVVDLAGDVLFERPNAGTDTVESYRTWTLDAAFENLTLIGTNHVNATGNAGNNVLTGNAGNNVLAGGLGNDTYYIQNTADHVVETWDAGSGIDQIYSSVTYSLFGRPVENLTLTGEAHIDARGNSFANQITGNAGSNTLNGMNGNDWLTGGTGADIFLFLTGSGVDTVADFSAAQGDWININAYSGGVENGGGVTITQSGADALINLGGGHSIRVLNTMATDTAFLDQIVW